MPNTKDQQFSTEHLKVGLKERAVKSAGVTLAAQGIKLALQLGSLAIMARLLEPADFGLVAMVTVFTNLALQLMDGGLSMATIQRDEITHAQVSNLFWVNGALGIGLCLLGILISPIVALIYEEPRLTLVMVAMSFTFFIGGISVQHEALLRRQMRFKALSVIDIASMALGVVAGITAAWAGLEYWALVIMPVATFGVKTILRWFMSGWKPSFMSRNSGVKPLLGFGVNLSGANLVGYMAVNLTPFAIGFISGAQSLGLFNRSNMLTSIPSSQLLPPVMNVVQPTLARVAKEPERLRKTILSIMGKLILGTMFVTLSMAVLADWIVELFLGPGWDAAVPIFRMLAVFSLVEPVAGFMAVSLIATGNARALLHWKVITLLVLIVSVAIGAFWGSTGVVAAYALSGVFIRLPGFLFYSSRFMPVTFWEFNKALLPSLACAFGAVGALYGLRQFILIENPFLGLAVFALIAAAVYATLCLLLKPTRRELTETVQLLKLLISRKVTST
ncbi:lipopolysaccharide biosynthesis protein [Marinobacter adhaerens]|uniref:Lipopolysaccharide biosynthesis protein n=1 Tax=Marinobacter adhaerens TaxID=1033846 RepID=A0A851HRM1_9GAMM|nr:lipopolysaccharide biosynthesis protein [Marinobacter adhaerens]NWN91380.1 lipopolysaccharide biosynthesis protein [Marinobacter adhaerens]